MQSTDVAMMGLLGLFDDIENRETHWSAFTAGNIAMIQSFCDATNTSPYLERNIVLH